MDDSPENLVPLLSSAEIAARVDDLARQIVADMGGQLVMVVLLKGAFVFAADLMRAIGREGGKVRVEFMQLSSYGAGTESSGEVRLRGDVPPVSGERVLLVDDILDSGRSVLHARDLLHQAGATEVRLCVLLDKPSRRTVDVQADHVGFSIPNVFVVGYGIDCDEMHRQRSDIASIDELPL